MAEIADSLRSLFEARIEETADGHVIHVPDGLVDSGTLDADDAYRVALLDADDDAREDTAERTPTTATTDRSRETTDANARGVQDPPVDEGDVRTVAIDTLGDQGDGIAKVERGFIVIVPGTAPGDRLDVEITDVKDTVAFARPL